ncbi:MAG TPA: VCBS repeat-containing protein, partial [Thermoanaerobaculia bacterium]
MRRTLAVAALLMARLLTAPAAPAAAGTIRFVEGGAAAGARVVHHTRAFPGKYADVLGMFTAGGAAVAVGDYDGDGWDDLFVTDSAAGGRSHLLHNNGPDKSGHVTFTDVAEAAGVAGGNDPQAIVSDAIWFDADNDGREDLLVARFGTPILYRNLGGGRFKDVSAVSGLTKFGNTIAVIAFDYDNDGRLDL